MGLTTGREGRGPRSFLLSGLSFRLWTSKSIDCARKLGGNNPLPGTNGGKSLSPLPAPKELVSQGSLRGPRREEAASQLAPDWFSRLVCQGGDHSQGRDFSVVISVNEETRRTCLKVMEKAQVNNILTL